MLLVYQDNEPTDMNASDIVKRCRMLKRRIPMALLAK